MQDKYPKFQFSIFCGDKWVKNAQLVLRAENESEMLELMESPRVAILCGCGKKLDETVNPTKDTDNGKGRPVDSKGADETEPKVDYPACEHERVKGFADSVAEVKEKVLDLYPDVEFETSKTKAGRAFIIGVCSKCKAKFYINESKTKPGKFHMGDWI